MELQIFQNAEFGSVRSTMIGGEPFFVGKDVAGILGYADPNKAIGVYMLTVCRRYRKEYLQSQSIFKICSREELYSDGTAFIISTVCG